jgi:hypothetical protein
MGARTVDQLQRNLESIHLTIPPVAGQLLRDATNEVKLKLGSNLDCYESGPTTRIQ